MTPHLPRPTAEDAGPTEPTWWVESFERRSQFIRPKRRIPASDLESAMAAMRVAATLEMGAVVIRVDRCRRTGQVIGAEVVKAIGRMPVNYTPALSGLTSGDDSTIPRLTHPSNK